MRGVASSEFDNGVSLGVGRSAHQTLACSWLEDGNSPADCWVLGRFGAGPMSWLRATVALAILRPTNGKEI